MGSSPHTRDKCIYLIQNRHADGIIPAYAGQILLVALISMVCWDHPRIRGTNIDTNERHQIVEGSPPHTRDKCVVFSSVVVPCRIIPAYAGLMFTNG